jgi:hypothetical protein
VKRTDSSRPLWVWIIGAIAVTVVAAALIGAVTLLNRALPDPDNTSYDDLNRWITDTREQPDTPPPGRITIIDGTQTVTLAGTDGVCWAVRTDTQGTPTVNTPEQVDATHCAATPGNVAG